MRLEDERAANKIQVPGNCLKVTPTDLKINSLWSRRGFASKSEIIVGSGQYRER